MTIFSQILPAASGAGTTEDKNNCAVRAVANATAKDYKWLHNKAKELGRKDGQGTEVEVCLKLHEIAGLKLHSLYGDTRCARYLSFKLAVNGHMQFRDQGITLGTFIKQHPKGRFVVGYKGHHLAVVNGQVIDSFASSKNKRLYAAWVYPEF